MYLIHVAEHQHIPSEPARTVSLLFYISINQSKRVVQESTVPLKRPTSHPLPVLCAVTVQPVPVPGKGGTDLKFRPKSNDWTKIGALLKHQDRLAVGLSLQNRCTPMKRSLRGAETFAVIVPIDCDKGVNPHECWLLPEGIMNQETFSTR
jgi:hypothetical protein